MRSRRRCQRRRPGRRIATISESVTTIGADIEAALASIVALDGMAEVQDAIASTESCQRVGSAS